MRSLYRTLSVRYLSRRWFRALLIVASIALGVGTVAGNLFVNTNSSDIVNRGTIVEVNLATGAQVLLGTGGTRAFGAVRERIPGSTGPNFAQGVGVEVGETEAAIDLDIVVEYGASIAELGRSIQRNVKQAVERMTGLRVVEVNVSVDDVYLAGDGDQDTTPARVS